MRLSPALLVFLLGCSELSIPVAKPTTTFINDTTEIKARGECEVHVTSERCLVKAGDKNEATLVSGSEEEGIGVQALYFVVGILGYVLRALI